MKAVVQRVAWASVEVDGHEISRIDHGMLVFLGIAKGDGEADKDYMVEKVSGLRIFSDANGKMNLSLAEARGSILIVSQFTLLADTRKGRRPGFDHAAPPATADPLYNLVVDGLRRRGFNVATGQFGAHMRVRLENDGPVTFLLDSRS
jgi:D-aminoacyl-tRNA deacylase